MSKRRNDMQVFSISFLDVLSCALGGVLMLLLMNIQASRQSAETYAEELEDLEEAQAALIGLEGEMHNVVFIFDTSGSMADTGRFHEYQAMLQGWVTHIAFERFNVIRFSGNPQVWRPGQLVEATDENRHAAVAEISAYIADGTTNTLAALVAAFALPGIDTIVLMSDGRPDQPTETIHAELARLNATGDVTINCVAMGDYFGKDFAEFLQRIARDHRGMFIGR